ncbi:MAG: NYN domain-containing protein [Nitrospira sp. SB0677_bin_15]|nr:NYN domain-containing protein [Nitrospira sp. SB0677_bin_15]
MRTRVYVDGFNLYYGALKGTSFKWLNLVALSYRVLPSGHTIEKLKYFTAKVSGASDADAPARQQIYLNALRTLPEMEICFGSFLAKTVWRPLVNLPIAERRIDAPVPVTLPAGTFDVSSPDQQIQTLPVGSYASRNRAVNKRYKTARPSPDAVIAEVHTMEEKGSDVSLAVHLLNDAWKNLFDVAVVVSNDTDLITPIRMVTMERGKVVYVVCPGRWSVAPKLQNVASHVRHIRQSMLRDAQFPHRVPGTNIAKPASW